MRAARADQAARYFASHAATWDRIRAMHIAEDRVEGAIRAAIGAEPLDAVLDIGTGTGRMLELVAPQANRALGHRPVAAHAERRARPARPGGPA